MEGTVQCLSAVFILRRDVTRFAVAPVRGQPGLPAVEGGAEAGGDLPQLRPAPLHRTALHHPHRAHTPSALHRQG